MNTYLRKRPLIFLHEVNYGRSGAPALPLSGEQQHGYAMVQGNVDELNEVRHDIPCGAAFIGHG